MGKQPLVWVLIGCLLIRVKIGQYFKITGLFLFYFGTVKYKYSFKYCN